MELLSKNIGDHGDSSEEEELLVRRSSDLNISFGYQCSSCQNVSLDTGHEHRVPSKRLEVDTLAKSRNGSFTCLSGAAISANFTLANTNICNGLIGDEILPELDSPNSFRRMISSPSMSRLDLLSTSQSSSASTDSSLFEISKNLWRSISVPTKADSSNFLTTTEVQTAGGAAGEDRVQAVCSEKNGWLICGIYDGFNGRDAADFLAVTLYDNIVYYLYLLECRIKQQNGITTSSEKTFDGIRSELTLAMRTSENEDVKFSESFRAGVLGCLITAVEQAENDFMCMVEKEMEDRPDLVSVGSCVLVALLHGTDLCILNLGDSRAVLASMSSSESGTLKAIQLTEIHTVDNQSEYEKLFADHPDDPSLVLGNKIKGKLRVTRAFGVGYLKKKKLNDALMGILRVRNLCSPPYVYTNPHTLSHKVTDDDLFVVLGSDGLFDFFSNDEVVQLVYQFIHEIPSGDPAKYLIEQLLNKAAKEAGLTTEELVRIPVGSRRKYHDDVTIIVIILGNAQRTMTASTPL